MKNQIKKNMNFPLFGTVFCCFLFSLFIFTGESIAQHNSWEASTPNPPSGPSTDDSGLVGNGGKDFDFDLFETQVSQEIDEVNDDPNLTAEERTVRIKVLDEAIQGAEQGFAISPSFDIAFMKLEPIVENRAPNVDLPSIIEEYKVQFEQ